MPNAACASCALIKANVLKEPSLTLKLACALACLSAAKTVRPGATTIANVKEVLNHVTSTLLFSTGSRRTGLQSGSLSWKVKVSRLISMTQAFTLLTFSQQMDSAAQPFRLRK